MHHVGTVRRRHPSVAHQGEIVGLNGGAIAEEHHQDGESDARFSGGERHHEEGGDVPVGGAVVTGEGDERQVHRVQHQLDGHEDDQQIAAIQHTECADEKENRAQVEVMVQTDRSHQMTFLASSTTPTIATSRISEITSNGYTKSESIERPTVSMLPNSGGTWVVIGCTSPKICTAPNAAAAHRVAVSSRRIQPTGASASSSFFRLSSMMVKMISTMMAPAYTSTCRMNMNSACNIANKPASEHSDRINENAPDSGFLRLTMSIPPMMAKKARM